MTELYHLWPDEKRGFVVSYWVEEQYFTRYHCTTCGRLLRSYKPGKIEITFQPDKDRKKSYEKGTKWPDFFGYDACYNLFVFSEKALLALQSENLIDFNYYDVILNPPYPVGTKSTPPPKYYWIEKRELPDINYDMDKSGIKHYKTCPECKYKSIDIVGLSCGEVHYYHYLVLDEWKGNNLFSTENGLFCTKQFYYCVKNHNLTNISFSEYGSHF